MDRVKITTAQNVYIDYEAAGVGDRAIAAIIDLCILISYLISMTLATQAVQSTATTIVILIPYFLYFVLSEILFNGQTIGKKLRGIKVTRLDGTAPHVGDYIIRWLFRLIEVEMTLGLVALVTVIVRGKGQRIGDMAANTAVVKISRSVGLQDTIYTKLDTDYSPTFDNASLLSEAEITLAKEVLDTLQQGGNAGPIGEKMKATLLKKLEADSPLSPIAFLQTVIKDYNHMIR
ncbi:MAG: RDD family protein [Bacteroidota bacterium]